MQYDVNVRTSKKSSWTNKCQYIVLHHTGWNSNNFESQWRYLYNNKAEVSCHYVVGQAWEVAKIANDFDITWHAGESKREGKTNLNYYSIWIEVVSGDGHTYTDIQRNKTLELIRELLVTHNLSVENIVAHFDISPGRKHDVWPEFYFSEVESRENLQEYLYTNIYGMNKSLELQLKGLIGIAKYWYELDPENREFYSNVASEARKILEENGIDTQDTK